MARVGVSPTRRAARCRSSLPDVPALVGAAAVPAAPLLVEQVSPDQPDAVRGPVARLREQVREVLSSLPPADVTVLVASGTRGVHDSACATFAPLGVHGAEVELPVVTEVVEHLSRLTQYPMLRGDRLDLGHSVLVRLLRQACGLVPVVALRVPSGTEAEVLVSVGASIDEAVEDAGTTANVVVASDLSAALDETSPRYLAEGAQEWDARAVEAVRGGDLRPLVELGPDEAGRVHATGWAPLVVLHGACAAAGLVPEFVAYEVPRGVGELVALCRDSRDGHRRYSSNRREPLEGVLPRTGDPRG